jgi:hypothetical protein
MISQNFKTRELMDKYITILRIVKLAALFSIFFILFNLLSCDLLGLLFEPNPMDYEYHTHPMYIYYKVIDTLMNKENDTIIRAEFNLTQYEYFRPPQQYEGSRYSLSFSYDFPSNFNIILSNQDTTTKVYATEIYHFTGYQQAFGGDTMYFAKLSSAPDWCGYIKASQGFAFLSNGRKVPLKSNFRKNFPNWLRNPYGIKIKFIWNGLISGDTNQLQLNFNSNNILINQIYP